MTTAGDRTHVAGLVFGLMAGQVVATAARLRLADHIASGARTGTQIAEIAGLHGDSVTRLCRALAALGLLSETEAGVFALTATGALLRTDRPDSLDSFVLMFTTPLMQSAWQRLDTAVRTGAPTFEEVFGAGFFDHLATQPELSARFNASMRQGSALTARLLPHHYDFGAFSTIADIGGAYGTPLAAILSAHPEVRGILFDTDRGIEQAEATLRDHAVTDRYTRTTGDFYREAAAGADLYLLKSVIHDWDDDRASTILNHIHRVIPPTGRLLLIEPVLPETVDGSQPPTTYLSDLNMLVNLGGRERTRTGFETLCARAGSR
ncbi:methyltransferase [Nocardia takedensis]